MNEQRKVVYAIRDQALDKSDLRERLVTEALPDTVSSLVDAHCVSEYAEEWDVEGLVAAAKTYWPSQLEPEDLAKSTSTNELYEQLMDEALAHYDKREAELTPELMRDVERQVMLRVIDLRWRAHLHEMDYLRAGIGLRAMGQKDPLVEWQREGFDMFGQMMHGAWQDFIRHVMMATVQVNRAPATAPTDAVGPRGADGTPVDAGAPAGALGNGSGAAPSPVDGDGERARIAGLDDGGTVVQDVQYSSPEDPSVAGATSMAAAARAGAAASGRTDAGGNGQAKAAAVNTPVVKSEWAKTPRNAPCPCGSGKKFKMCHGNQQ
jgi:preprotein translocase subunit SecA